MRVVKHEFYDCNADTKITILPIADVQLTSRSCREDYLKNDIQRIQDDPYCFWLSGGDLGDYINAADKRFDFRMLSDWAQAHIGNLANAQTDKLAEYLEPIAGKCLGMLKGNHENTIHRYTGNDVYKDLVGRIKQAGDFRGDDRITLGYNGFIVLDFYQCQRGERSGRRRVVIYAHHGTGGGSTVGGKANVIQKMIHNVEADLIIVNHLHHQISFPDSRYRISRRGKLVIKPVWGVMTPSYLESYADGADSYGEQRGYKPIPLSWLEIDIFPIKRRVEKTIEIRSGLR